MKRILIVEGLCHWNDYLQRCLAGEGYLIRTTRSPILAHNELDAFRPDLVLIGLGVQHDQRWQLFRQIKTVYPHLPVLVYQVVNGAVLEDIQCAVAEALRDAGRKHGPMRVRPPVWSEPMQIAV